MATVASRVYRPSDFSEGVWHEALVTLGKKGFSPEMAAQVVNTKSHMAEAIIRLFQVLQETSGLVSQTTHPLSKFFGQGVVVDPLPPEFTEPNLAKWAKFNLKPVFLPHEEINPDRQLKGWIKLEEWFYNQIRIGNLSSDSAMLYGGWYLADFTPGVDYTDGTQIFPNDPLAPIVAQLREEGKVGKHDNTPLGSRFSITPDEWTDVVCPAIANHLGFKPDQVRLERAIEFNAIGNLYDPNRGKFNMWEWFHDHYNHFGASYRLFGGHRVDGGLARVCCSWSGCRRDDIAGCPLVSFR